MVSVVALIPARGGSKGIPGKNIRRLGDHPQIAYSIASALAAGRIDRVIVSTDSPEIARIAGRYGAEAPFLRPPGLAQDGTTDLPVFAHALEWLGEHEDCQPDIVVQVRPTSPFRPRGLLDDAVELLIRHPETDCIRSVAQPGQNPYKMWTVGADGLLAPLLTLEGVAEPYNAPRQQLPGVFWQTGHVDVIWSRTILEKGSMTGSAIRPVLVESRFCVDIDEPGDLVVAGAVLGLVSGEIDIPSQI
jgi:CMP-N-acetylneuraminic acid synthetase